MTDVETTIRDFIVDVLGTASELDAATPLLEQDLLDSVGIYELVVHLEGKYGIEVDDEEVVPDNFGTITSLARLVESKR